jgi:hypothetical protein
MIRQNKMNNIYYIKNFNYLCLKPVPHESCSWRVSLSSTYVRKLF